jgi:hypothetical protein
MAAASPLITGTDFIMVSTKDLDKAVDFYGNVLASPRASAGAACPRSSTRPAI